MLTSGTIAALILIPLGLIATTAAAFMVWRGFRDRATGDLYKYGFGWFLVAGGVAFFSIPAIIFPTIGLSLVGFSSDYMAYKPVSGQVEQIAARQIADGKGMSQRYVFKISGKEYGVDDTRAALVKEGDTVNLNCTKEFVWGSTNNGYACNWG